MTLEQVAKRVEVLEAEVGLLRKLLYPDATKENYIPGFGIVGRFKDDPTFADAVRLGRAWRDKVNRESLEELDREEQKAKTRKKKAKPRKSDAGA
jgi:hypothetical protein